MVWAGNLVSQNIYQVCFINVWKVLFWFVRALLDEDAEGFEVSYNSAGLLCHILSDGEKYLENKNHAKTKMHE